MWSNFYASGGFGMYPTTLFGFFLVASAVVHLLRPERRYLTVVICLGLLTLFSGVLGCAIGTINTFRYVQDVVPDEQVTIAALGCAESLNNVVLALLFLLVTMVLVTAGAVRTSTRRTAVG